MARRHDNSNKRYMKKHETGVQETMKKSGVQIKTKEM